MNKYQATLTLKFDFTTVEELDGAKLTEEIKEFIMRQFIPRIKVVGTPGVVFDTQVTVEDVEPDDLPGMDEKKLNLALADYLERRMEGGTHCNCRTCSQVAMITDMLGDDGQRKFIEWLRTGKPMIEHDPEKLLKVMLTIGMLGTMGQPDLFPRSTPTVHRN